MVASFILNTKAEFLKSKRTAALWLTVAGAAFVPVVSSIRLIARPDHFVPMFKADPWQLIFADNWNAASLFLLPMYVILVISLVVQTEYRNNTWKQVYASPRSLADIFFSRLIVIHSLIILCFLLFNVFIMLTAYTANIIHKQYTFFEHPVPWKDMLLISGRLYYAVLGITAVQYWLSLRFRNFIAPMGIGLALLITGFMIHQWEKLYYYPYMYPAISFIRELQRGDGVLLKAQVYDAIWFVMIVLLAFGDMVTRREKG